MRRICQAMALSVLMSVLMSSVSAMGQTTLDKPVGQYRHEGKDSGIRANRDAVAKVVYSDTVREPNAAWLRLYFGAVELGKGSFIRVTSLKDGEVQELDSGTLAMWSWTSIYLNGSEVKVELIAGGQTERNRVVIDEIAFQRMHPVGVGGVCGICNGDSRTPSSETWAGRLLPVGCSASVYNEDSCLVSAGHCIQSGLTIQFNVPNSSPTCALQHPPAADQFPVLLTESENGGVGADWAVMTTGTNFLGETIFERYGELRPIGGTAGDGTSISTFGYGGDVTCTLDQTQQTSTGTVTSVFSNSYRWTIDTTGGASGSGVLQGGAIVGIVTHCTNGPFCNSGSRMDIPAFVAARNTLCNGVTGNNDDCSDAFDLSDGVTAFSTVGASTDGPSHAACEDGFGDDQVGSDIWYDYTASCTGDLTVSTCNTAAYDTKLAIYDGCGCPASGLLSCDDDTAGCGGNTSEVTATVQAGSCYKVRVGGFNGATGTGSLTVTCEAAGCIDGGDCSDGNPCTDDVCTAGVCSNPPNSASCSDGDNCTVGDTCAGGACVSGPPLPCDDGNECTLNVCTGGVCSNPPNDGISCNDPDPCTTGGTCQGGSCVGSPVDCDDGFFCNGDETCVTGNCISSGDPCGILACDEFTDTCISASAELTTSVSSSTALPNDTVTVELYLSDALDVRGYEVGIQVVRTSGTGELSVECPGGTSVDQSHPDFIFQDEESTNIVTKSICQDMVILGALIFGSVDVGPSPAYLGEVLLRASPDAALGSTFDISVVPFPDSVLADSQGGAIPFTLGGSTSTLTIGEPITTEMSCALSSPLAAAGGSVNLDLLLSDAEDLRGYETFIQIERTSGFGDLTVSCPGGVEVDQNRPDWVFAGAGQAFSSTQCESLGAVAALLSGGVNVGLTPEYLANYTLEVSPDATEGTTFEISIVPSPETVLSNTLLQLIPYNVAPSCTLTVAPAGTMTCALSTTTAPADSNVTLDVFLQEIDDLRAYQTQIQIVRTSGTGDVTVNCPTGVEIDQSRPDWAFAGAGQSFPSVDCAAKEAVAALVSGGVNIGTTPAFLSKYHLTVSADASPGSTFEISIQPPPDSELGSSSIQSIPFTIGPPCVLTVGPATLMTCQLASDSVGAGGSVDVDVFLQDVDSLRGYQTRISVARTSGVGTPSVSCPGGVAIDDARPDWVFAGIDPGDVFNGFDCPAREAVSATVSGFVDVGSTPAYLSTYTVDVSGDATEGSTFQVRVDSVPDSALAEFPTLASLPFATGLVCEFSIAKCEVVLFGDVDRDGDVSILDIQCVLDAFSNDFSCGLINTDLVSFGGECGGDGMVDLFDIFAILDAFSLMATCPDPCLPPG